MYHILFIHSFMSGCLGCLHFLVIMTMGIHIFLGDPAFQSFWYITRNGIPGSYGNSVFNFFEVLPSCFPQDCIISDSRQQCKHCSFSTALPAVTVLWYFDSSHPDRYEAPSHCWLAFAWWLLILSICLLWRNVCACPLPVFESWVLGILYVFWILIPYETCDMQMMFSPILWAAIVYFGDTVFRCTF